MFTDHSERIMPNPAGLFYGVAVADLDGDGQSELFVAGFGRPNRVLKWLRGNLRDVTPPMLADPDRLSIGVAAADVDADGREELYVLNSDTFSGPKQFADRLFDCQLDGRWVDLFSQAHNQPARNFNAGRSVGVVDRRGNGRYGFIVANYDRPFRFYELQSDGQLSDLAPALGLNLSTGGRSIVVAPLASQRPDLFCVNEHGPNFLFRNTGVGSFLEVAAEHKLHDPDENARGVTVLDADDDGRLDVCFGNWDGPHRLMVRRADGTYRDVATPAMAFPSLVRTVIAADFDNDGYEELFFNNLGEPNRIFRYANNHWHLADAGDATEPERMGTGAAVADIDSDGQLELLIAHGESSAEPLSLYKAAANANAWLRVQPLTRFGAPARGALVKLLAGGRTQLRVICGGSGYLCQMEPVAHFGLGSIDSIELLQIVWPDGTTASMPVSAVCQTIVARYPGA